MPERSDETSSLTVNPLRLDGSLAKHRSNHRGRLVEPALPSIRVTR